MTTKGNKMAKQKNYLPEKQYATVSPGEAVRMLRNLQGLTQGELARLSGVPQAAISAIETETKGVGIERAKKLAAALSVHPAVVAFPDWHPTALSRTGT